MPRAGRCCASSSGGERTVSQLAEPFAISLAAASKHIKALENAGLIQREVRGRTHVCRLDPGPLASAHEWLSFYERFWTERLDILDRLLREDARAPRLQEEAPEPKQSRNPKTRRRQMNEHATPRRLRRTDRADHAEDPAPAARPDRAGVGLSHRKRPAPQMAGGGRDGDEGRRGVRTRLAQRRAHQSARPAAGRLFRRAPHARPKSSSSTRRATSSSPSATTATSRSISSRRATKCC